MYDTPEPAGILTNSDAARETARREIESGPQQGDAAFDSLPMSLRILAENILRLLIRTSLTTQEQASVAAQGAGSGRTARGTRPTSRPGVISVASEEDWNRMSLRFLPPAPTTATSTARSPGSCRWSPRAACPSCAGDLEGGTDSEADGEVVEGTLTCLRCEAKYAIQKGVPRLNEAICQPGIPDFDQRARKSQCH